MSNKQRKSILSYLKLAMQHIIKWNTQPDKRSNSWIISINKSRTHIKKIQKEKPSLSDEFLKNNWDDTLKKAITDAEKEMQQKAENKKLTWKEVFEKKYIIPLLVIAFAVICYFC